jgi:hypothetical protein
LRENLAAIFITPSSWGSQLAGHLLGIKHFPRKRKKLLFDSILRANYELDASSLDITLFALSAPSSKVLKKSNLGR